MEMRYGNLSLFLQAYSGQWFFNHGNDNDNDNDSNLIFFKDYIVYMIILICKAFLDHGEKTL